MTVPTTLPVKPACAACDGEANSATSIGTASHESIRGRRPPPAMNLTGSWTPCDEN